MEPLFALTLVTALVLGGLTVRDRAAYTQLPARELALRCGVTVMFVMTGLAHFIGMRQELIDMVPPQLPAPGALVTITGVLELLGAAGLWLPRTRFAAAACLTVLLVAMFPANMHLALTGDDLPWHDQLLVRTLLQVVFVAATGALTWWNRTRPGGPSGNTVRPRSASLSR